MISIVKELLFSEDLKAKHRTSPRHFIRDRILTFPLLVLYLANFIKGSCRDELDLLFQAILKLDVPERVVTPSALSQARRKLSYEVFIDLQDAVCAFVNDNAPLVTYHGMRVFAVDGSTMILPDTPENKEHFGTASNKNAERAMARISIFHDVLNRITIDALIRPYTVGETTMAWDHLEDARLPANSLILMDRGYTDFSILKTLFDEGRHFCVRVRSDLRIYKAFLQSGRDDMVLDFEPPEGLRRSEGPDSLLSKSFKVRLVIGGTINDGKCPDFERII
ncbi:MAG: IS4 family transposase [Acidobacteriota bacterium]|nr:IS4 family transposase [Acidobacteriota bacterium]